ncbi:MAG: T9SS type A sorting domain-containing protein [Bacteroidetes bacterium]|nr:T9SS type A sorting domain-containing protein [Bacteroidota bacterium]
MMKKNLLLSAIIFCGAHFLNAQSTWQQVYNIFQAKCSGCHNQSNFSGQLNLSAGLAATYTAIVNKNPVNPAALSKGDKRIAPGDPHRSFLLRKINDSLDMDNGIVKPQEGDVMPSPPNPALSKYEIELVRQWIFAGAPQTGMLVDTAVINEYYTIGGINNVTALAPPAAGTGFQVHLGKIFVPKGTETEIFIKYNPKLPDTTEVIQLALAQPPQSHHFVIYKFFPGQDINFAQGFRYNSGTGPNGPSHGSADALCAFAPQQTLHTLPPTTAYLLEKKAIFDLNLHILNPSPDSVLAAEIYFNMYTQPVGTAQKYMYRRNFPDLSIVLPPGDTTSYNDIATDSSASNLWEIWILYTHTHRFGIDYDVWQRNPDGSQGNQVYEGWMDWSYTFNQGYYGWGIHAPQEHFQNPFLEINPLEGLIHKATWYNYGTDTAYFGLTSLDEMMVMGFEYTNGPPIPQSGINEMNKNQFVKFFPNPFTEISNVLINNTGNYQLKLYDMFGKEVSSYAIHNSNSAVIHRGNLAGGIYLYKLFDEKNSSLSSGKIVIAE